MLRAVGKGHERQHNRHFDQDAHDGGQGSTRPQPKRLIATATASSKKFEVPISAQGRPR